MHDPPTMSMLRRCKLHLLFCVATCLFAAVPAAVMLPLMAYLEPGFLTRLDAAALAVASKLPTGWVAEDRFASAKASDKDANANAARRHMFRVGQVFKHKVRRYTGAIARLIPIDQRGEHDLGTDDMWYSALIDRRYNKNIGQGEVFVAESEIERMYPGSKDGFLHPKRGEYFRTFDPEESMFVPKRPGKRNKRNKRTAAQKKKKKKKGKKGKTEL